MSTTIFCTFDQQDLADLAMGRLRSSVQGIHSIHFIEQEAQNSAHNNAGIGYLFGNYFQNTALQPSRPVSVKIVCDDGVRNMVRARLVNLHAYKIVEV